MFVIFRNIQTFITTLVIFGLLVSSAFTPYQSSDVPNKADSPEALMDVLLLIPNKPLMGKDFELEFTVIPSVNAVNTSIEIDLPDGCQLIEGDLK